MTLIESDPVTGSDSIRVISCLSAHYYQTHRNVNVGEVGLHVKL